MENDRDDVIPVEDFATAIAECRKDPQMDALFSNAPHGAKLLIGLLFYSQVFGENVDEVQYQAALTDIETSLTADDIGYLLRSDIDDETKDYLRGLLAKKDVADVGQVKTIKLKPVSLQREKYSSHPAESKRLSEFQSMMDAESRRRRVDMILGITKKVALICVLIAVGYYIWGVLKGESSTELGDNGDNNIKQAVTNFSSMVKEVVASSLGKDKTKANDVTISAKSEYKLDFNKMKNRVVVIGNEGNGGGTAFLLKMDGKKYLVTNDHVSQSTDSFNRIYLLDGSPVKLGPFEVAEDRDIVRFEVDNDLPSLELDESIPEIDEKIVIYGNSMGRGAVTEEKGVVKAIGPMRLEVDAKVVPGNSGSPVLNMNGKVIGILTYGTNDMDEDDWQTRNTRYASVRRWAVRFSGIKWNKVEWNDYVKQTELMVDIRNFRARLNPFIDVRQEDPKAKRSSYGLRYDELTKRIFHTEENRFRPHLIALSNANDEWDRTRHEFKQVLDNRNQTADAVEEQRKKFHDATRRFDSGICQSLATMLDVSTNTVWTSFMLREQSTAITLRAEKLLEIWQVAMHDSEDKQKEIKRAIVKALKEEAGELSRNDAETPTYKKSKNAVVILRGTVYSYGTTKSVHGTGFLSKMGDKKYLVTNFHVIDCHAAMQVLFQDGKSFKIPRHAMVDVARNRDLARIDLSGIAEASKFNDDTYLQVVSDKDVPDIGSKVEFYGNADGKDVVTVTVGKVMAVANEYIEIDAPIQGGNSGSPLIRTDDGMVVGVTTRTAFNQLNNDPSKIGTRYDPKIKPTREFAERFAGVRWMSLGYEAIVRGAKNREEVRRFLGLLYKFCFATEFCLYRDMPEYLSQFEMPALRKRLKNLAQEDELLRKSRDTFEKMCIKNTEEERHSLGRGTLGSYSRLDFENQIKLMRSRTVKCYEIRGNILSEMEDIIRNVLLWQHEVDFYAYEVNYMFRHYRDKYRFQLRGNNLPGIPSVPSNVRGNSRRRL